MFRRLGGIAVLLGAFVFLRAQDIDSVPTQQKRNPANLADQITDGSERSAFLQLFKQAPPAEMRGRAETFLARYPQSAFLAQAYEVAARGCFDVGEYEKGLDYARQSLQLLPENPLLLVPVADVEARQNRNSAALDHAVEALSDLDRFASPSSIREEDWPEVKQHLKSTANFAKGRALLQQAIVLPQEEPRRQLLKDSEAALLEGQRLNPQDLETDYVLGLAQLSSGKVREASGNFVPVYRGGGELGGRALENLQAIYRSLHPAPAISFETFLRQAAQPSTFSPVNSKQAEEAVGGRTDHPMTYFGSDSCRSCHSEIYTQWSQTGMAKMLRPYATQNVRGDFNQNNEFYLGDKTEYRDGKFKVKPGRERRLFARMIAREGRHYFEILQADGKWHSYPVDYTIGSKFEQAYATKLANGEIHVFPIQYNLLHKQWVNFWKVIDGPGSERADPRTWEKLDGSTSYQAICAVCHTSRLRNTKGGGFDLKDVEFDEPGIDCETCHGPSGTHVLEMNQHDYHAKEPLDPPVNFHKVDSRKFVAVCAQCHMQSAVRNPGPNGELNYVSSAGFFGNRLLQPFGEFSRKGFYKDGRFRQTTFMVEALERSQCFRKAEVSCGTCHDPHSHDAAENPTSLKFQKQPDLMCTGCHNQFKDATAIREHTHHRAESEGSRCVSCHMPRIMDALLFRARYHQIDDIPNAEMTRRFGQEESPNACLLCHMDKTAEWVAERLSSWKPRATRQ